MKEIEKKEKAFGELLQIMATLRAECPWDKKQTFESLRPLTIEEVYELGDAILAEDAAEIKKELGDLLMHMVFYAQIAEEKGLFDIADVLESICEKLKYRHPHIYGNIQVASAEEVTQNWEQLKLREKGRKHRVLEGVPVSLPALVKAYRIQDKARGAGFDWEKKEDVWEKVQEELEEFEIEWEKADREKMEEEFGDFLFSVINAARLYGINPENALEKTNNKFIRRFSYIEDKTQALGKQLPDMSLEELEQFWQEAKKEEHK